MVKKILFLLLTIQTINFSQIKDTLKVIQLRVDTTLAIKKSIYIGPEKPIKVAEPTDLPIKDSNLFLIRKDGFYGYMDREGNMVINPKFYSANDFSEGLAYADLGNTTGFIDKMGKLIIDLKGYESEYFSDGIALLSHSWMGTHGFGGTSYKYLDKEANFLLPESFSHATHFRNKFAFIKTNNYVRLISKDSIVAELDLEITPYEFSEGIARFSKKIGGLLKWGFIDTTGNIFIKPMFDYVDNFSDELAVVCTTDTTEDGSHIYRKYGYINKKGEIIIDLIYDYATDFSNGFALVRNDSICSGINKEGRIFSLINFYPGDSFPPAKYSEGLIRGKFLKKDERYIISFIDTSGKSIIKIEGSHASNFGNGLARIWFPKNSYGDWGYINRDGKIIFNPESIPSSIIPDSLKTFRRKPAIQ